MRSKDAHTSTAPLLIDGPNSCLAGRERPDGNDETALEGTEEDSSFPAGFWHPYGRGNDALPPSRVVCFSPEALAQVTLQFPYCRGARLGPGTVSIRLKLTSCYGHVSKQLADHTISSDRQHLL